MQSSYGSKSRKLVSAWIDDEEEECDEGDEKCLEAEKAEATRQAAADEGNVAMQKGRVPFEFTRSNFSRAPTLLWSMAWSIRRAQKILSVN